MFKISAKKFAVLLLTALLVAALLTAASAEGGILKQNKNSSGTPIATYYANGTAVRHFTGNTVTTGPLAQVVTKDSTPYVMTTFVIEEGFTKLDDVASSQPRYESIQKPYTVQLPNSITEISNGTFQSGGASVYLQSINFPQNLKTIGNGAFLGCSLLTSVDLNNGLETIGDKAFSSCDGLTSITVPDSVTSLGTLAFSYCENLRSITFSSTLTDIPEEIAIHCPSLAEVTIPEGVVRIRNYAFSGSGLTSLSLPESLATIGAGSFENTSLSGVEFNKGLQSIGNSAFRGSSLTSVEFPKTALTVGAYAFADTPLATVTIPAEVKSISKYAFPAETVIYGYRGTAAQNYAQRYGNTFIPLDDCGIDVEIKEEHVNHGTVKAGTVTQVTPFTPSHITTSLTLLSDNDTFHDIVLTVTLPDGFSFEYDRLVTEMELPQKYELYKDRELKVDLPAIYPIYLGDLDKDDMYDLTVDIQALDSVDAAVSGQKKCGFFDPDEVTHTAEFNGTALRGITYEFDLNSATGSGTSYNKDTAALAALLADGAYTADTDNSFLTELGFSSFSGGSWYNYNIKNCAYYMCRKRIIEHGEIKTLIYVVCRGTAGSGTEWLGNFQVGSDTDHTGFLIASRTAGNHVEKYCSSLGETPENTIFLVTGHSKAAAAANNLGNLLNKSGLAPKENISVYTFATPTVSRAITTETAALAGNENIFNFVHYQDAIRNAPSMQYYGRYGHTTIFGYGEPASGALSANFGYGNYTCLGSEENYTVTEILNAVMYAVDPKGMLSGTLLSEHVLPAAIAILAYTDALPQITPANFMFYHQVLLASVSSSPLATEAPAAHSMEHYYNAVKNGASGASFETVRARTEAAWQYYQRNISASFADYAKLAVGASVYIVHRFKCPIDVYVEDANGNIVLSMENGNIVDNAEDIAAFYDGDAKVLMVLRNQAGNYTIRLAGYDDGTITHALSSLGVDGVQSAAIRYGIPVQKGETLTLPADGYLTDRAQYTVATDSEEIKLLLLELENVPYTVPELPIEPEPEPTPEPEPSPEPMPSPEPEPSPEPSSDPKRPAKDEKDENKDKDKDTDDWDEPDPADSQKSGVLLPVILLCAALLAAAGAFLFLKKKKS